MLFDPVPLVGLCTHHPAHERRRLPDALIDAPADAFLRDAYRELVTVGSRVTGRLSTPDSIAAKAHV